MTSDAGVNTETNRNFVFLKDTIILKLHNFR